MKILKYSNAINLDFTFNKYRELCQAITNSNYILMTIENYLSQEKNEDSIIILRHDVDSRPFHALRIAKIENEYGLKSTYYFRMTKKVFQRDIIEQIQSLGHEIGYHYEVLDKSKGDIEAALKMFKDELETLRQIAYIKTMCMHGNSRTPWDNRDIWKEYDYTIFNLLGEAYLSVDFNMLAYISDSARTWDQKYKIKDIPEGSNSILPRIKSTDKIIGLIKNEQYGSMYILTHPDEWTNNIVIWLWDTFRQYFRNRAKLMLHWWYEKKNKMEV